MTYPIASAEQILRDLGGFGPSDSSMPPVDHVISVIGQFGAVRFDVPDEGDADGFLFQYTETNWPPGPGFMIGFARQFEVVDETGEYEECTAQM